MNTPMFCFQCEQTAGGRACTGAAGVCGKTAATAALQDQLTGALIGLATGLQGKPLPQTAKNCFEWSFTTLTNVNFNPDTLQAQIDQVHQLEQHLAISAEDYDMRAIWQAEDNIRS